MNFFRKLFHKHQLTDGLLRAIPVGTGTVYVITAHCKTCGDPWAMTEVSPGRPPTPPVTGDDE